MITIKELQKINTYEELEELEAEFGAMKCDISYCGGGIGFYSDNVADVIGVEGWMLPNCIGAGCNYLGGGLRGAIFPSTFHQDVPEDKAEILTALADACVRVYESIENEAGLNSEEDEDGDTNWDAIGTNASRREGIISAY
jgi:hypothetical protein